MLNKLWGSFIIIGILYAFFTGKVDVINMEIIESGSSSLELFFSMFPLMILWSGARNQRQMIRFIFTI